MRRAIKRLLEKVSRTHIFRDLPGGVDLFHDLRTYLPNYTPQMIFDVGANVGQSARSYLRHFPHAQLFCFEPVSLTYSILQKELAGHHNVHCVQMALGSKRGVGQILLEGSSDMYHMVDTSESSRDHIETIQIETVDQFCLIWNIPVINFLKVDTEGYDLEVLMGSDAMLADLKIDVIQVEAGMHMNNTRHVGLERFKSYLEPRGYLLFRIYEQIPEWPTGEPHLRRSNPVFLSSKVINANRKDVSNVFRQ
jgi:FkbM family methyltransferase